jgi:hypothetical protein
LRSERPTPGAPCGLGQEGAEPDELMDNDGQPRWRRRSFQGPPVGATAAGTRWPPRRARPLIAPTASEAKGFRSDCARGSAQPLGDPRRALLIRSPRSSVSDDARQRQDPRRKRMSRSALAAAQALGTVRLVLRGRRRRRACRQLPRGSARPPTSDTQNEVLTHRPLFLSLPSSGYRFEHRAQSGTRGWPGGQSGCPGRPPVKPGGGHERKCRDRAIGRDRMGSV